MEYVKRERASREAVETLLRMPFDDALNSCTALQHYIQEQADADDVSDEFRASWGLEAPEVLRALLAELIASEISSPSDEEGEDDVGESALRELAGDLCEMRTLASEASAVIEEMKRLDLLPDPAVSRSRSSGMLSVFAPPSPEEKINRLRRFLDSPEHNTIEWGGWLPGEAMAPPAESADDLLALPFGEALQLSRKLRNYLADADDQAAEEEHFYRHWGPDAPPEFVEKLSEILNADELVDPGESEGELPQLSFLRSLRSRL